MPIIVEALCKNYSVSKPNQPVWRRLFAPINEERRALEDVSFHVEDGETVGYIGPNGSGKSTTIKCLTGILTPTAGTVQVNGCVPWRERPALSPQQSVLFGQRSLLFWDLPVRDGLLLYKSIYRLNDAIYRRNVKRLSEAFEIEHLLERPARKLSLGERMRCELVTALLHDPRVLYLDEPTIGLDVVARDRLHTFLRTYQRERDLTLMLTTHQVIDIEELCPRVIVLMNGRKQFDGPLRDLKRRYAGAQVLHAEYSRIEDAERLGQLSRMTDSFAHDEAARTVRFEVPDANLGFAHRLLAEALLIASMTVQEKPLEKVLLEVFRDDEFAARV
ncbi:ATP-binding cassette domain-containing protein [Deinococcus sp. SM5_A1]|uniref:ABC transporter ATP-binding protein n=1 Tax=Deinococcus sp. SM5_A1 TaxID=3379094 RepID=UPI00385F260E